MPTAAGPRVAHRTACARASQRVCLNDCACSVPAAVIARAARRRQTKRAKIVCALTQRSSNANSRRAPHSQSRSSGRWPPLLARAGGKRCACTARGSRSGCARRGRGTEAPSQAQPVTTRAQPQTPPEAPTDGRASVRPAGYIRRRASGLGPGSNYAGWGRTRRGSAPRGVLPTATSAR